MFSFYTFFCVILHIFVVFSSKRSYNEIKEGYYIFNNNVKFLRKQKKLNQAELASLLKIDRSKISKIENGDDNTSLELAIAISEVFNISLYDMLKKDLSEESTIKSLDELYSEYKNILTEEDIEIITFIIQKRIKNK